MALADDGTPDAVLVVAAILGDLTAFEALVLRYRAGAIRIAQMIVHPDDAEDVAQEALLLAFKALPSLEEPARFPAWLHAITRRCAYRFSDRARARQKGRLALDAMILEQIPALNSPAPADRQDEDLLRALDLIPCEYALPLRLHFLDEMPLKRIAGFLGASPTTVKWRIHRGKQLLRQKIAGIRRMESWKGKRKSES